MAYLNHIFNIEMVCRQCHQSGIVNGYEHRCEFFAKQKAGYGQEFLDWWDGLPMKVKPRYD
jgi:hypothetical protein